jgi:hypothetical protein
MTMAAIEKPAIRRFAEFFESREQRHARLWVMSLRKASQQLNDRSGADTVNGSLAG